MVEFSDNNSAYILFSHKFMINVKDLKAFLSRYSIYVMHFKLVGLTSIDRYILRKREIGRSEACSKSLVRVRR